MDLRSLVGLIHQLLNFHQFPCAKAPVLVGSCYVLPVSPGIDGSLRIIWNYPEAIKVLHGSLSVRNNIDVPACGTLFYILVGVYFSLEYCGVEPKRESVPASGVPSVYPSKSTFIGLGPACVLDQAPFLVWVEPVLPLTLFRKCDCEWLVECISWKRPLRLHMYRVFQSITVNFG
jgi:hypothetical protein